MDIDKDLFRIEATIPYGTEYRWVREYVLDIKDQERLRRAFEQGYRRVHSLRHPNMVRPDEDSSDSCIRRKGLLLCEKILYSPIVVGQD